MKIQDLETIILTHNSIKKVQKKNQLAKVSELKKEIKLHHKNRRIQDQDNILLKILLVTEPQNIQCKIEDHKRLHLVRRIIQVQVNTILIKSCMVQRISLEAIFEKEINLKKFLDQEIIEYLEHLEKCQNI